MPEVETLEIALKLFREEFTKLQTEVSNREKKGSEKEILEVSQRINELQLHKSRLTDKIRQNIGKKILYLYKT